MSLALIVALPFCAAVLIAALSTFPRMPAAMIAGISTAASLTLLVQNIPGVWGGAVVVQHIAWLPSAGLNANFMLDGLGLLFALMILGIGLLVIVFAHFYLAAHEPKPPFFGYLLAFQGAMLGIVLSDNILILLIFWELTSISSFLLIGFWRDDPAARSGARMALVITGGGGLALLAGLLLLGNIGGNYDLTQLLTQRDLIQNSPLYLPALLLILIGAFTKSAQLPFHFWLPQAMAAPTPVSAYLHSATMVKAGIFLMARLWPVLAGTEAWFYIVTTTGLLTMVFAAKTALFKDDLKAILAYSTISHLGLITFLLGLGTKAGAAAAMVHILCHASFKAALFMVSGIVGHAAHRRDLRKLGGLGRLMPITFLIAAIASLSMAGVPPLSGFLSKELALEAAAQTVWAGNPWIVAALISLGALLSVAYSLRFLLGIFWGPAQIHPAPRDPVLGLWISPMVLAILVIAVGPLPWAATLLNLAANAVSAQPARLHLMLWHGLENSALWMSVFAFGGGILCLGYQRALRETNDRIAGLDAARVFDLTQRGLISLAQRVVLPLHDGALTRTLKIALTAILGTCTYAFWGGQNMATARIGLPANGVGAALTAALLIAVMSAVLMEKQRLKALLMVGIAGLIIAVGFAQLSAPDLALTQITVEVVSVILMLLALQILPSAAAPERGFLRRGSDGVLAALAGAGAACLAYGVMMRDAAFAPISAFHLENAKSGAGGNNAVNTIIVDFRGFDTYGEIIVLGIAAVIVAAMAPQLRARGAAHGTLPEGDPYPIMMTVTVRFLLPFALLMGIFIFLRGHNLPGGGFVAGLIFTIALVLQQLAAGPNWAANQRRINPAWLIGVGVLAASATGLGSWFAGRPFLTSNFAYIHIAPLAPFELATATLFDLGVFLCVLGAVLLILDQLSRAALPQKEQP